ncbi:MAG: hypothetical protein AABX70_09130 [Nanoarchaeota archaeon]
MDKKYLIDFDEVILRQLEQAAKNQSIKAILMKMLNRIEQLGPRAGELLDSQLGLYEVKSKQPPIRLYFEYDRGLEKITIFEYDMKTSPKSQKKTINRLRMRVSKA